MLSDRCPVLFCGSVCPVLSVCLSVSLVYCGQTVRWMKMKLGTEVGLDPGHNRIRLGPNCPLKEAQPHIFGPCLLWPNNWMDQDGTWQGGRPQPRRLCVRCRPSPPPSQKGAKPTSPIFGPFPLWPNGWMHQDAT